MPRKKNRPPYRALILSLTFSAATLMAGVYGLAAFDWPTAGRSLLIPLLRMLGFILVGLAAGQMIEALGWTRNLAVLARPLFTFSRLGDRCGAAFTAAFFSGVTANAMLVDYYQEGRITRRQLFLTNFINQLPAFFLHLPTTFFIVVPLTKTAGLLYFLITLAAAVVRTLLLALFGRLCLPPLSTAPTQAVTAIDQPPSAGGHLFQTIRRKLPRRMLNIVVYVVPIYIAVFTLNRMGLFAFTREWLARFVVTAVVPVESLSVVILSFVAEFTSGFAAAGALLDAGVLNVKQTVLALLTGNILAFPIRALRHQLPHYMGIFKPQMGTQLLIVGQMLRVSSLAAAGGVYYLIG
ncbi:MAG: nucleoside recognition protein [Desulfobacterales bacterium]|nr:nucleoside recognition protein [Desulfobacterales bacterium]